MEARMYRAGTKTRMFARMTSKFWKFLYHNDEFALVPIYF